MARHVLRNADIWLGAARIKGFANQVKLDGSVPLVPAPAFHDVGIRRLAGQEASAVSAVIHYDATLDSELFAERGIENTPIGVAPEPTDGGVGFFMRGVMGDLQAMGGSVDEVNTVNLGAMGGHNPLVRGTILHNAIKTVSGTGTGRQLGAVSSSQSLYAALFVLAASGTTPTLDVLIESDDNGGFTTPTTRFTFAQKTARGAEYATPVAGAITDDFWRVNFTIGGGGPSFEFVVIAGIQTSP